MSNTYVPNRVHTRPTLVPGEPTPFGHPPLPEDKTLVGEVIIVDQPDFLPEVESCEEILFYSQCQSPHWVKLPEEVALLYPGQLYAVVTSKREFPKSGKMIKSLTEAHTRLRALTEVADEISDTSARLRDLLAEYEQIMES